jgi:hypothetical protein
MVSGNIFIEISPLDLKRRHKSSRKSADAVASLRAVMIDASNGQIKITPHQIDAHETKHERGIT